MLAQEVVAAYGGRVRFASENFGASPLAERFGVTRYPAVFVDDVLVARPADFGFVGKGEKTGRYAPWRNAASQAKFKADLARMIDLVLAGGKEALRGEKRGAPDEGEVVPARLPSFVLTDLSGRRLSSADLAGRPVVVEFWATWCPPCRATLAWLAERKGRRGSPIEVVAIAVESPEAQARKFAEATGGEIRWAMADAETTGAFGDVAAVPALFVFDRDGRSAAVFYGAPPDLHDRLEKTLAALGGS